MSRVDVLKIANWGYESETIAWFASDWLEWMIKSNHRLELMTLKFGAHGDLKSGLESPAIDRVPFASSPASRPWTHAQSQWIEMELEKFWPCEESRDCAASGLWFPFWQAGRLIGNLANFARAQRSLSLSSRSSEHVLSRLFRLQK